MIVAFGDIFRARDLTGTSRAGWVLTIVLLPMIGIFTDLIVRGGPTEGHAKHHSPEARRSKHEAAKRRVGQL